MKAFGSIRSLRDTTLFAAWLYGIARNTAFSRLRKTSAIRNRECPADEIEDAPEAESDWSFEDAETVHRALDRLPLLQKEVLTLFFLEDLSIEETAGIVGVPAGTVKSRLFAAKRALKSIIEEEEVRHDN